MKADDQDECERCAEVFPARHLIHLVQPQDLIICQDCLAEIKEEGHPIEYAEQRSPKNKPVTRL